MIPTSKLPHKRHWISHQGVSNSLLIFHSISLVVAVFCILTTQRKFDSPPTTMLTVGLGWPAHKLAHNFAVTRCWAEQFARFDIIFDVVRVHPTNLKGYRSDLNDRSLSHSLAGNGRRLTSFGTSYRSKAYSLSARVAATSTQPLVNHRCTHSLDYVSWHHSTCSGGIQTLHAIPRGR
jgi:hypothetical protein